MGKSWVSCFALLVAISAVGGCQRDDESPQRVGEDAVGAEQAAGQAGAGSEVDADRGPRSFASRSTRSGAGAGGALDGSGSAEETGGGTVVVNPGGGSSGTGSPSGGSPGTGGSGTGSSNGTGSSGGGIGGGNTGGSANGGGSSGGGASGGATGVSGGSGGGAGSGGAAAGGRAGSGGTAGEPPSGGSTSGGSTGGSSSGGATSGGTGGGDTPPDVVFNTGNANSPLATNLEIATYYTVNWPFVDIFPASGYNMYGDMVAERNADGWPIVGDGLSTLRSGQSDQFYQYDGQYVVLWTGAPERLDLSGSGPAECDDGGTDLVSCASRRAVVDFDAGTSSLMLEIRNTGAQSALTSMRVLMPGGVCGTSETELDFFTGCATDRGGRGVCPSGQTCYDFEQVGWNRFEDPVSAMVEKAVFHPDYLQTLRNFRALRFMDWMYTNDDNPIEEWSQRSLVRHPRYAQKETGGVALEYMVALANVVHADPWFTLPHRASDDYARQFAARVNELLHPDLKVYVEYSNETWNAAAAYQPQYQHVIARGNELGLGGEGVDEFGRGRLYHAQRSAELAAIFETEMADPSRVVGVLGAWNAQPAQSDMMLQFLESTGQLSHLDVLAVAPYFQGDTSPGTIDGILANVRSSTPASYNIVHTIGVAAENGAFAQAYGLSLVAYEGGQHFTDGDFMDLNRDPRMGEAYTAYLQAWRDAGGTVFAHYMDLFTWGQWGYWGAREAQTQPLNEAPKALALENFIADSPCWWDGCSR